VSDLLFTHIAARFSNGGASASGFTDREFPTNSTVFFGMQTADATGAAGSHSAAWTWAFSAGAPYSMILVALKATPATQIADLQQWKDTLGNVVSEVNGVGQIVQAQTSGSPTSTPAKGATAFDPATNKLWIYGNSGWKSVTLS
jgi:hypothetical protein